MKLDDKYVIKLEQAVKVETREKVLRLSVYAEGQEEAIGNVMGLECKSDKGRV